MLSVTTNDTDCLLQPGSCSHVVAEFLTCVPDETTSVGVMAQEGQKPALPDEFLRIINGEASASDKAAMYNTSLHRWGFVDMAYSRHCPRFVAHQHHPSLDLVS